MWAAEHYGVDATGITLSKNQHAHVQRLIEEKGLQGRVRMELRDYRELDESAGLRQDRLGGHVRACGPGEHARLLRQDPSACSSRADW